MVVIMMKHVLRSSQSVRVIELWIVLWLYSNNRSWDKYYVCWDLLTANGPAQNLTAVLLPNVQDQTRMHLPGWEKESSAKAAKNLDLSA